MVPFYHRSEDHATENIQTLSFILTIIMLVLEDYRKGQGISHERYTV